jgi:hypothetical protein
MNLILTLFTLNLQKMCEEDILMIQKLAECSREQAEDLLKKAGNVFEALCIYIQAPLQRKERSEQQKFFDDVRQSLAEIEKKSQLGLSGGQSAPSEQVEQKIHLEEKVQQKSCSQVCLPPSPELKAEKQATVYPSQSECSFDLQSSDHK